METNIGDSGAEIKYPGKVLRGLTGSFSTVPVLSDIDEENAPEDDNQSCDLQSAHVLPGKEHAQQYCDHRIHVCICTDLCCGSHAKNPDIRAVSCDRSEEDQVGNGEPGSG